MDLSILLYLVTFLLGFGIDRLNATTKYYKTTRKIYVIWLYVFLCFGYMTGSDWRSYEISLEYLKFRDLRTFEIERGFYLIFWCLKQILFDYWLIVGFLKCLYLYSIIRLFKKITTYYLSAIAFLLPMSLVFMLIDNPLRFMCALILVNFAINYLVDKKYWFALLFIVLSSLFHETSIFFVLFMPIYFCVEKIFNINRLLLFVLYILLFVAGYSLSFLTNIFEILSENISFVSESKFEYYSDVNNENFFNIGVFVKLFFFIVILLTKPIIENEKYGKVIYVFSITYYLLDRFLIFLPAGFRLIIPFQYFIAIYYICLLYKKQFFGKIMWIYYSVTFLLNVYSHYVYIPYSNSIPYIIFGHKSYDERSTYNIEAYKERLGKSINR